MQNRMCLQRLLQSEAAFLNICFAYFWKKNSNSPCCIKTTCKRGQKLSSHMAFLETTEAWLRHVMVYGLASAYLLMYLWI